MKNLTGWKFHRESKKPLDALHQDHALQTTAYDAALVLANIQKHTQRVADLQALEKHNLNRGLSVFFMMTESQIS